MKCEAFLIGGSAGSLEVLLKVLPDLDASLPFPIIIVLHRKPGKDNILTDLLAAKTQLHVKEIEEKEKIKPSTIYIAPPNYHLLIERNYTFSLDASEKVNFSRPSIDVSFESAADTFKEGLFCLLLSGANSDGSEGLVKVRRKGGTIIVQDPASAVVSYMPEAALAKLEADEILKPQEIANYLNNLAKHYNE